MFSIKIILLVNTVDSAIACSSAICPADKDGKWAIEIKHKKMPIPMVMDPERLIR